MTLVSAPPALRERVPLVSGCALPRIGKTLRP
jgi:hypothetical protein